MSMKVYLMIVCMYKSLKTKVEKFNMPLPFSCLIGKIPFDRALSKEVKLSGHHQPYCIPILIRQRQILT